jgi:hypothetical protein
MRTLGLAITVLLVTAATGCEMDIPLRRAPKPQAKTEQSGGLESDEMRAATGSEDQAAPRRFSRDGVPNSQMFRDPAGYNDSPIR